MKEIREQSPLVKLESVIAEIDRQISGRWARNLQELEGYESTAFHRKAEELAL